MEFKKNSKTFNQVDRAFRARKALEIKEEVDKEKPQKYFCAKKNRWMKPATQIGFKAKAVQTIFKDMVSEPNGTKDWKLAIKLMGRNGGKIILKRIKAPSGVSVQVAEKGSYREENIIKFIEKLPQIPIQLCPAKMKIFTLDDYSAHLVPSVRAALLKKGYFLVLLGGGVTGNMQVNDTHCHKPLKAAYRDLEMAKMIDKLREEPSKIPTPSRDEMMEMDCQTFETGMDGFDSNLAFKQNLITIALDGSEDHLGSQKLWNLVGEELKVFRENLLNSEPAKNLHALQTLITPPAGVKRNWAQSSTVAPQDEGMELWDREEIDEPDALEKNASTADEQNDEPTEAEEEAIAETEAEAEGDGIETESTDRTETGSGNLRTLEDLAVLDRVEALIQNEGEKSSIFLKPFFVKVEREISTQRRYLRKRMYSNKKLEDELAEKAKQPRREKEPEDDDERGAFDVFDYNEI